MKRGEITDSVSGTHNEVKTKLFYNSKVKPAMVEADLAREWVTNRQVDLKRETIKPRTYWASFGNNNHGCARGVGGVEIPNVKASNGATGSGVDVSTNVISNVVSVKPKPRALLVDNKGMAVSCVSNTHSNDSTTACKLPLSTGLTQSWCLTENRASKADDQGSGNAGINQNAVSNDMLQKTLLPIYDINYAGM